jgi:hypothetical protein
MSLEEVESRKEYSLPNHRMNARCPCMPVSVLPPNDLRISRRLSSPLALSVGPPPATRRPLRFYRLHTGLGIALLGPADELRQI